MNWNKVVPLFCVAAMVALAGCGGPVDQDSDGLNRTIERQHGLSDTTVDTDGDGLNDSREFNSTRLFGNRSDTDGDGLNDRRELKLGANPSDPDIDEDGATDGQEVRFGSNLHIKDTDNDGIRDGREIAHQSSPTAIDTDRDGIKDPQEIRNPRIKANDPDTDGDGIEDGRERELGTLPYRADSDGDGRNDRVEINSLTVATDTDTDNDGLSDGVEAPPGSPTSPFNATRKDTDGDRLTDNVEKRIGTSPTTANSDGDRWTDYKEHHTPRLRPARRDIINGSPTAGLANATLRREARQAVTFLTALPTNRTKRDRVVTAAATKICNIHNRAVPENIPEVVAVGNETYRNTYRVVHAAEVLQRTLGADIDVSTLRSRMRTARRYTSVAAKYSPVIGSYLRLHEAACAVKRGEPGAKRDFYIAAATFAMDAALAQNGVIYKASFKTTGLVARRIGLMRLARVCGYKCVGLVESEIHWAIRGAYYGALDHVAREAIEGNLTTSGWNTSVRNEVVRYVGNHTDAVTVGRKLVMENKVVNCVESNLSLGGLWKLAGDLSKEAINALRTILVERNIPNDINPTFLRKIDSINNCIHK